MKRLERLTSLVSQLQSRRYSKIEDLVSKFDVTERTIYRDLKSLEEAGVPITYEKDKGYYILDTYYLAPLSFTLPEAKSMILTEQLAHKYLDSINLGHFLNAMEKIRNQLKSSHLDNIEYLNNQVKSYVNESFRPKYIPEIIQGIENKHPLDLSYSDFGGQETFRRIEPIGITFYSQSWHVIAWCQLREDYRDFSILRIKSLTLVPDHFERSHLTLEEYIEKIENANSH